MLHHVGEPANAARIALDSSARTPAVRFQICYANGARRQVAPAGHLLIVGRDPTCDLVIPDGRCSRRHAVIEVTPAGPLIRDTASVNGVYVNGERVDRAPLAPGDEVRLGDTRLIMLEEAEDEVDLPVPPAPFDLPLAAGSTLSGRSHDSPWPAPVQAPALPQASDPREAPRPLTVIALATLWLSTAVVAFAATILLLVQRGRLDWRTLLLGGAGLAFVLLGAVLGPALLARRAWARGLQILLCPPAALSCLLAPVAVVVATYLLNRRTRAHFLAPMDEPLSDPPAQRRELAFTLALGASILLAAGSAVALIPRFKAPLIALLTEPTSREDRVLARLRALRVAEESFRRVCNVGYADMQGLRDPASAIPGYPRLGAPFLTAELARSEADGYQFFLTVHDSMPATADCPTVRRFRSYQYAAAPLDGQGRFFLLASDGAIHVAVGRAPSLDDPIAE
jgi:hypothetical protein